MKMDATSHYQKKNGHNSGIKDTNEENSHQDTTISIAEDCCSKRINIECQGLDRFTETKSLEKPDHALTKSPTVIMEMADLSENSQNRVKIK